MSDLLMALEMTAGHLAAALAPLFLSTALLLAVAYALDRLLERCVSASLRILLYFPIGLRLILPADLRTPLGLLGSSGRGPGEVTLGAPTVELAGAAPAAGLSRPYLLLLLGYLMGVLLLTGRWLLARHRLRQQLGQARPLPLVAGRVPVLEHAALGPVVVGLARPRIVLPTPLLARGDAQAIDLVLRHESAHVLRRDHLLAALLHASCVIAWPLLPVWLAARRVRLLMEYACDERAVRGEEPALLRRYGELLLALAEGQHRSPWSALVPSFGSPLAGRLRALGRRRRWPLWLQLAPVVGAGALALACSGAPDETATPSLPAAASPPTVLRKIASTSSDSEAPPAEVRGSLDKVLIKQRIASNMNEVKRCYEQELATRPELAGRAILSFTITGDGSVKDASVDSSSMGSDAVGSCIARAAATWTFPAPLGGGIVMVKYPFTFTASRSATAPPLDPVRSPSAEQRKIATNLIPTLHPAVKPCLDAARGREPGLGNLSLSVTVGTQGELARIGITGSGPGSRAPSPELTDCVVQRLSRLGAHAPPKTPIRISIPLAPPEDVPGP